MVRLLSPLAEFGFAAAPDIISAADKAERISFGLLRDVGPTFDRFKNSLRGHMNPLFESF